MNFSLNDYLLKSERDRRTNWNIESNKKMKQESQMIVNYKLSPQQQQQHGAFLHESNLNKSEWEKGKFSSENMNSKGRKKVCVHLLQLITKHFESLNSLDAKLLYLMNFYLLNSRAEIKRRKTLIKVFYRTFHRYIFNLHMPEDGKTHMIIPSYILMSTFKCERG